MKQLLKKYLTIGLFLLLFSFSNISNAQNKGYLMKYIIENGDTVFIDTIDPVYVFGITKKTKKDKNWKNYRRTVYNFKKVYPYALKAKLILQDADSTLANNKFSKREKEKYLKEYEKKLFKEFEKPIRDLSFSQGRLLLKLLDREVGKSSFYIIKNYRGGIAAGFWQGVAKLFGSDLKKPYNKYGEDKEVEELVVMYHNGSFNSFYYSIFKD